METQAPSRPERNLAKQLTLLLVLGCIAVGVYAAVRQPKPPAAAATLAQSEHAPSTDSEASGVRGRVLEVIQVSSYTYLRLMSGGEEVWAAVSKAEVPKGAEIHLSGAELMTNFTSKELGRTFPAIYFGQLASGAETGAAQLPSGHPDTNGAPSLAGSPKERGATAVLADTVPVAQLEKAQGGYRIGEIYEKRSALNGQKVRVRGTVVRVTERVMGTNFIHLRDRSGSAEAETHDLVLKVAETPPNVGEVALLEGTVESDVDLGAGYSYKVLIADAAVVSE